MSARCRMNANDVCEVCSMPAGLLVRLDWCMEQTFPGRGMMFLCFEKPMGFKPWERTIVIPGPRADAPRES